MEQWLIQALKTTDSYPPSLVNHITENGEQVSVVFIFGIGNVLHQDYIALQTERFRIEKEQQNKCTQPYWKEKDDNNYVWDPNLENTDSNVVEEDLNTISDEELGELLDGIDFTKNTSEKNSKSNPTLSDFSKGRDRVGGRFVKIQSSNS
jgi:hypothetical protein